MLSLYEILKASKTGIAPDMWTALAGKNWGGADSGTEVKELTGIPPLSFRANGTPLLDYLISGNMVQTGTPTPTNPIQPQECGERTGNLFNAAVEQGSFNANTGAEIESTTRARSQYGDLIASGTYTINATGADDVVVYVYVNTSGEWDGSQSQTAWQSLPYTFTLSNSRYVRFVFRKTGNTKIVPSDISSIMLNEGSQPPHYEPYGYKIPISSANITTNVYLGEVPTTRKIKKLVLDGNTNISQYSSGSTGVGFIVQGAGMLGNRTLGRSSHFKTQSTGVGSSIDGVTFGINNTTIYFTFSANSVATYNLSDVISIKQYLAAQYAAGTPVIVWYVLATETTGIVNEPLRKIGDYADTLNMEQAGVQILTNKGDTVIDVETTLKPSEMYIKYQG